MIEQYVIKTRSDEDEYLAYNKGKDVFYLTNQLSQAEKYYNVEAARKWIDVQVLKDSKYKSDIYKIVQALEFVARGV